MKHTIYLVLLALSATTVYGRLGENQEECARRYGPPTEQWTNDAGDHFALHLKNHISVIVSYLPNEQGTLQVESVVYSKQDESKSKGFGSAEALELLAANAQGSSWNQRDYMEEAISTKDALHRKELINRSFHNVTWDRVDGKVIANYTEKDATLAIATWVFIKRHEAQANKTNPLQGF